MLFPFSRNVDVDHEVLKEVREGVTGGQEMNGEWIYPASMRSADL